MPEPRPLVAPRVKPEGRRARVRIGQRDLFVRRRKHPGLELLQALHLLLERCDLVVQTNGPSGPAGGRPKDRPGRAGQRWLLPVGAVELVQIALDTVLDLLQTARHLRPREVLVPGVDRLELAAIDRHAGLGEQVQLATQRDEPGTDLADRRAIVLAKVGDRLVIRREAAGQPHHFHVAPRLAFQSAARLNPVEVAVDVELQQNRRMIGRSPRPPWRNPLEAQLQQLKLVDEDIDHPNRIVVVDPVLKSIREQRRLAPIDTLDKSLHPITPNPSLEESHRSSRIKNCVFTQPGS